MLPTPITTMDKILTALYNKINSSSYTLPTAHTNQEKILSEIVKSDFPSGGGGGINPPDPEPEPKYVDLLENTTYVNGYLTANGNADGPSDPVRQEQSTYFIDVLPGDEISFQMMVKPIGSSSEGLWCAYCFYNSNRGLIGTRISFTPGVDTINNFSYNASKFIAPTGSRYIRISYRRYTEYKVDLSRTYRHPIFE